MSHTKIGRGIYRMTRGIKDGIRRMLIPTTIFESMGFTYLGPVDGHDTEHLISLLKIARDMRRPVLIHVLTKKGMGYGPAEEHPKLFHGVGKFDPATGQVPEKNVLTFSDAFGAAMCTLAEQDPRICAITAAMPGGTGLLEFKARFPKRMFDVGIAEEHAVSMAGGLAKAGMVPVVALYSTFLQRAYDMILQDICLQKLHMVLAVDRAGLVGEDGETHHGVFDVGFLRQAPGMTVLCPASTAEVASMMHWASRIHNGPVAVRYPRGSDGAYTDDRWNPDEPVVIHKAGKDCAIISYGKLINNAMQAADILKEQGIDAAVIRLTCIEPLPVASLNTALNGISCAVVIEETCNGSGIYQDLTATVKDCRLANIDLGKRFTTHGSIELLYKENRLDAVSVAACVQEVLHNEN